MFIINGKDLMPLKVTFIVFRLVLHTNKRKPSLHKFIVFPDLLWNLWFRNSDSHNCQPRGIDHQVCLQ